MAQKTDMKYLFITILDTQIYNELIRRTSFKDMAEYVLNESISTHCSLKDFSKNNMILTLHKIKEYLVKVCRASEARHKVDDAQKTIPDTIMKTHLGTTVGNTLLYIFEDEADLSIFKLKSEDPEIIDLFYYTDDKVVRYLSTFQVQCFYTTIMW